jgi:hypothetical protein
MTNGASATHPAFDVVAPLTAGLVAGVVLFVVVIIPASRGEPI